MDVEGSELAILKSIDFKQTKINVFTIENTYSDTDIRSFMLSNNYKLLTVLGNEDDVYINKGYNEG